METQTVLALLSLDVLWMIVESNVLTRRDLLALCRVRIFATAATQALYENFQGNEYRFLETIIEKPELALHVKGVTLEDPHQVRRLRILRHWEHFDRSVYHRSIRQLALPGRIKDSWAESIRKGDSGTVLALLLAHLPNLQRLTVREGSVVPLSIPYWTRSSPLFWFSGLDEEGLAFEWLREVTLNAVPFPLHDFTFLFRIPTMRKFHVHNMAERRSDDLGLGPRSSNITDVGIHATSISFDSLVQVIGSCRRLVRLTFTSIRQEGLFEDLPTFFKSLAGYHDTLETLELRCLGNRPPKVGQPCSLKDFRSLREVACDVWVFDSEGFPRLLSAYMPPKIRKIHIHGMYSSFLRRFLGTEAIHGDLVGLDEREGLFEELAEVKLFYEWEPWAQEAVPYRSNEGGVQFAAESWHGSSWVR